MRLDFDSIPTYRKAQGENQLTFWGRLGVMQSGGSRYESGRSIATPVALLLYLYDQEIVSDAQLLAAMNALKRGKAKGRFRSGWSQPLDALIANWAVLLAHDADPDPPLYEKQPYVKL